MRTKSIFLSLSCSLLVLSGCIQTRTIQGDGNVVTQTIDISDYDVLEIEGATIVTNYTQTDTSSALEIKTDQNIFEKYEFKMDENKLKIRPKKEFRNHTNFQPTEFVVTTHSRALKKFAGAGNITFNANSPLQANELEVDMAGSGTIQINDTATFTKLKVEIAGSGEFRGMKIDAREMKGDIAGSNTFNLGGNIGKAEFSIAGSGRVNAFDCTIDNLECNIAGSGDIAATVTTSIRAKIAGSGSVKYKGNPQDIKKSVMGSGSIEKVE